MCWPRSIKSIFFSILWLFIVLYIQPLAGFDRENYLAIYRLRREKREISFAGGGGGGRLQNINMKNVIHTEIICFAVSQFVNMNFKDI